MSRSHPEYLKHILDEINYIECAIRSLQKDVFLADETLKRSFVRSIEIIGEAAKKLESHLKDKYPDVEWKRIAGMRNHLIHDYFGIDYHIVWDVAKNKLPRLKQRITDILRHEAALGAGPQDTP